MKIISNFEIMQNLMDSYVCLEMGWADFISNERSLRNSILLVKFCLSFAEMYCPLHVFFCFLLIVA